MMEMGGGFKVLEKFDLEVEHAPVNPLKRA